MAIRLPNIAVGDQVSFSAVSFSGPGFIGITGRVVFVDKPVDNNPDHFYVRVLDDNQGVHYVPAGRCFATYADLVAANARLIREHHESIREEFEFIKSRLAYYERLVEALPPEQAVHSNPKDPDVGCTSST